jgi:hypothetical protein
MALNRGGREPTIGHASSILSHNCALLLTRSDTLEAASEDGSLRVNRIAALNQPPRFLGQESLELRSATRSQLIRYVRVGIAVT